VPQHLEGVPDELLDPRRTWADPAAYDAQASKLADMFVKNFEQFAEQAGPAIVAAGPQPATTG
jgi:phosphoenolpyruvate carboxykinase (ATP)